MKILCGYGDVETVFFTCRDFRVFYRELFFGLRVFLFRLFMGFVGFRAFFLECNRFCVVGVGRFFCFNFVRFCLFIDFFRKIRNGWI